MPWGYTGIFELENGGGLFGQLPEFFAAASQFINPRITAKEFQSKAAKAIWDLNGMFYVCSIAIFWRILKRNSRNLCNIPSYSRCTICRGDSSGPHWHCSLCRATCHLEQEGTRSHRRVWSICATSRIPSRARRRLCWAEPCT